MAVSSRRQQTRSLMLARSSRQQQRREAKRNRQKQDIVSKPEDASRGSCWWWSCHKRRSMQVTRSREVSNQPQREAEQQSCQERTEQSLGAGEKISQSSMVTSRRSSISSLTTMGDASTRCRSSSVFSQASTTASVDQVVDETSAWLDLNGTSHEIKFEEGNYVEGDEKGELMKSEIQQTARQDHKITDKTPGALKFIAGDWGNYRRTSKNMSIVFFAFAGTLSLPLLMLDVAYAMGAIAYVFGVLYLTLPHDIIPDHKKGSWTGLPWGYADNFLLGVLPIFASFYQLYGAHQKAPVDSATMFPLFLGLLIVMALAFFNEGLRFLFVGLWAMFGQFILWFQVIHNSTLALGLGLYFFGFIYNSLPVDFIPDGIRYIGKVDDIVIGYLPVVGGMVVSAIGVLGSVSDLSGWISN